MTKALWIKKDHNQSDLGLRGTGKEKIEHSMNVSLTAKPIKQKFRRFAPDKKEAIRVEIK